MKKTLVIGASSNPSRYANMAIGRLKKEGHEVWGIGKRKTITHQTVVGTDKIPIDNLHTVTLYIRPEHQREYYDYLLSLKPKRIIFNPGTENEELARLAREHHIEVVYGCTLVMLASGQY